MCDFERLLRAALPLFAERQRDLDSVELSRRRRARLRERFAFRLRSRRACRLLEVCLWLRDRRLLKERDLDLLRLRDRRLLKERDLDLLRLRGRRLPEERDLDFERWPMVF